MKKIKRGILSFCLFYIIYVFLYGVVIKFTMPNEILFSVKTYIPETILGIICVMSVMCNGSKIQTNSALLIIWSLLVFIINVINYGTGESMFYLLRDIYIPMLTFCFIKNVSFDEDDVEKFQKRLIVFSKAYLVVGLALCIMEQIKGWEWTSAFYTGYSFYGQDPVSKVKIAHNLGLLRASSLTGNFATFGFYCLICYAVITSFSTKKSINFFWTILTAACLILCTNKTAIVGLGIVLLFKCTVDFRKKSLKRNGIIIAFACLIVFCSGIFLIGDSNPTDTNFFTGFVNCSDIWAGIFDEVSWTEMLFPYRQFMYSSGAEGGFSFWDNTYFYALFSQGIIGTCLWVWAIGRTMKKQMLISKNGRNRVYLQPLVILLCALSMTVNITQGRGFLSEFLLLLEIGSVIINRGEYLLELLKKWIKNILLSIRAWLQYKSMALCRAERGLTTV